MRRSSEGRHDVLSSGGYSGGFEQKRRCETRHRFCRHPVRRRPGRSPAGRSHKPLWIALALPHRVFWRGVSRSSRRRHRMKRESYDRPIQAVVLEVSSDFRFKLRGEVKPRSFAAGLAFRRSARSESWRSHGPTQMADFNAQRVDASAALRPSIKSHPARRKRRPRKPDHLQHQLANRRQLAPFSCIYGRSLSLRVVPDDGTMILDLAIHEVNVNQDGRDPT